MRIFHVLIIICLFQYSDLYAQQTTAFPFSIEGQINADTGTVELRMLTDISYYPKGVQNLSAKVKNGKFFMNGYIPYPQGFEFRYGSYYYSDVFVIEKGRQLIKININSNGKIPEVQNEVMKEYYHDYIMATASLIEKKVLLYHEWDSLNRVYQRKIPKDFELELRKRQAEFYNEGDKILLQYAISHPNSYLAFWKLINLASFSGYESIFDSIFNQFSDSLKGTYAGKILSRNLKIAGMLQIGKVFPPIISIDIRDNKLDVATFLKSEYTLVDFWYSNCGPCIAQFPDLKQLYEKYKNKGFEIVGISTDKLKYKTEWQVAVKKYQLDWPQYWDTNGQEATRLSIRAFPTNFLLDGQGRIIKKNMSPVELKQFLLDNIK